MLLALAACVTAAGAGPANAINTTVYALRPLNLVDITDKNSADAPGDVFLCVLAWRRAAADRASHTVPPRPPTFPRPAG